MKSGNARTGPTVISTADLLINEVPIQAGRPGGGARSSTAFTQFERWPVRAFTHTQWSVNAQQPSGRSTREWDELTSPMLPHNRLDAFGRHNHYRR